VAGAAEAARAGSGLLVADTTEDPADPVVRDVMAGYGVMAAEIRRQSDAAGRLPPTHLFVQAGVGGLAAAMAEVLRSWLAPPAALVVVEPSAARCVGAALDAGHPVQLAGDLETSASMLSCGKASAPALDVLMRHDARALSVGEEALLEAPRLLTEMGGPRSTPSGAAGLAGAVAALGDSARAAGLGLGPDSRLLILVTEGAMGESAS
jgi:diaminopropionate ammonia-lyase